MSCADAAALCTQIEQAIDAKQSDATLIRLLARVQEQGEALGRGRSAAAEEARHMTRAVTTWREVWPRLGRQAEFRMAVAREAHRWAKQFAALATQAGAP